MENRRIWYIVSSIILLIGAIATLIKGITFGIDFTGGTEIILRFNQPIEVGTVRGAIDETGISGAEIKTYGEVNQILIRVKQTDNVSLDKIKNSIANIKPGLTYEILKEDKIGPKIGEELKKDAIYAVFFSLIAILVYLAFRFEFVYALGAVFSLFHDLLLVFGICILFNGIHPWLNLEFSQTLIASFLTLLGFSVNDTVIIFDRIRENRKIHKTENLISLMNRSINETLSRTIITSGTVFVTVLVLFIFGGEVIRSFAFSFLIGVVTGTYSSIFVASSFVIEWNIYVKKLSLEETYQKA
ncbi:MAG TPA: protein translocase subunit SecF [Bacteroidota bacterium]|nr:protein translocase subunit SecF [Bacteroidota bacterium]